MSGGLPRVGPDVGLVAPDARAAVLAGDIRLIRMALAGARERLAAIHAERAERTARAVSRLVAEAVAQDRAAARRKTRAGRGRRRGRRRKR